MKKVFALLLAAVLLSLSMLCVSAGVDVKETEKRVFENGDTKLPYRLVLPENYDENKSYPMLVFLHGAGERGNDNELQLFHCVQYLADNLPECIIVAPQCPANNQWVDTPWANGAYSIDKVPESNELKAVIELLDALQEEFNVDADRIYASGLSMGGFGTLYYALSYPQKFTYAYAMSPATSMSWFITLDQMKEKAAALAGIKPHPDFTIEVGNQDTTVSNADAKELSDAINDAAHCEWIARDGIHYWNFWQECLPKALQKAGESFK